MNNYKIDFPNVSFIVLRNAYKINMKRFNYLMDSILFSTDLLSRISKCINAEEIHNTELKKLLDFN